jgi:hypothetical protein
MLKSLFSLTLQHGIPAAIQCGLAVVLFFRARGLANIWHRIQIARYKRIDEAEQSDSVTPR